MSLIKTWIVTTLFLTIFVIPPLLAGVQTRIVGGFESQPNARPYFAGLMGRDINVTVRNVVYSGSLMNGSASNVAESILVDCGSGFDPCIGVDGNICLIERGKTTFREKALNCQAGGGIGAIIYNNVSGRFNGNVRIPLFSKADRNNDGILDEIEFETIIDAGVKRTLTELDTNKNGNLSKSEYDSMVANEPHVAIPVASVSSGAGAVIQNETGRSARTGLPNSSFCGGVYIGNRWVITAGHCVVDDFAERMTVNIGGHDLRTDQNNVIGVTEIKVHEDYRVIGNTGIPVNDFALLRLVEEPENIEPVAIATALIVSQAENNAEYGTAVGRGIQTPVEDGGDPEPGPPINTVFQVNMPFIPKSVCSTAYPDIIDDSMVCAGTAQSGFGTCFGDSGGPIVINREGIDYVAGLTSFGSGCALAGVYDVYSRVPAFLAQINEALALPPPDPKDVNNNPVDPVVTGGGGDNPTPANTDNGGGIGAFSFTFLIFQLSMFWLRKESIKLDRRMS